MADPSREPSPRYSGFSVAMHWLMLALLVAVYACIELRELYPRGSDIREGLKTWHFMLGLSVFVMVWLRLAGRALSARPPVVWTVATAAAAAGHVALYLLMIAMPVMGWLLLSAEGDAVPFYGLTLPPLVQPDKAFAEQVETVHTTVGTAGYWLIGLHATAALFHHYVLKDQTLRHMLPGHR